MTSRQKKGFGSTRWSLVLRARDRGAPEGEAALADLCRDYWYPLYAFIRRKGYDADHAADLTQGFFKLLLEKEFLRDVNRDKGRFRNYLLACCQHFLANEADRERALKRGGGRTILSFDQADARYQLEPIDSQTAEKLFERRWALHLLDRVLNKLRAEYETANQAELFDRLKPVLAGSQEDNYRTMGESLSMSEDAIKQAVRRMRQRYRERLRQEVAETIDDPAQVDEEIRDLFTVLAN